MGAAFYFGERFTEARKLRDDALLEHDPEKWNRFSEKDHAQTKSWTMIPIQLDWITTLRNCVNLYRAN